MSHLMSLSGVKRGGKDAFPQVIEKNSQVKASAFRTTGWPATVTNKGMS